LRAGLLALVSMTPSAVAQDQRTTERLEGTASPLAGPISPDGSTHPEATKDEEVKARSAFDAAEKDFSSYQRIQATPENRRQEYHRKFAALVALRAKYGEIAQQRVPDLEVAALCRQGDLSADFVDSLEREGCPENIKGKYGNEGCLAYEESLAAKVKGLKQESMDFYRLAVARAKAANLQNKWSRRAFSKLGQGASARGP
jgi:hypothetical protein